MSTDDLLKIARDAMATATNLGLGELAITVDRSRFLEISFREGKLEKIQESTSRSLGATLYQDGRFTSSSTSDLRPKAIEKFLVTARDMTALLTPDPFRSLPDPALYEGQSDVDLALVDPDYDAVDVDRRKALALAVWEAATADEAVISATSGTYDSFSEGVRLHSNGFEGDHTSSDFWMGAQVTVRDEGDKRPAASWWVGDRRHDRLPDAAEVGARALKRAQSRLGAGPALTRRCPMVVENTTSRRLLSPVISALSGRSLQQRRSFLEGKLGEQVGSSRMTVVDDPLIPGGFGSHLFDGEGIAAKRRSVFDKGVLSTYFIDTYYGKKLEMAPTTGGSSNLIFQPGELSMAEIVAQVGEGILVTSFLGGNSDPTTGDYSFGIRGNLIEGGQVTRPVSEMNITGNLGDLWGNLTLVGNDPHPYSSTLVPTLAFADIQFSGLSPEEEAPPPAEEESKKKRRGRKKDKG
jgi:PmbA protein